MLYKKKIKLTSMYKKNTEDCLKELKEKAKMKKYEGIPPIKEYTRKRKRVRPEKIRKIRKNNLNKEDNQEEPKEPGSEERRESKECGTNAPENPDRESERREQWKGLMARMQSSQRKGLVPKHNSRPAKSKFKLVGKHLVKSQRDLDQLLRQVSFHGLGLFLLHCRHRLQ